MKQSAEALQILLVEDNPGDVRLTREALGDTGLEVARDGEEALELLGEARRGVRSRPDLILLDLNLPRRGGFEVLHEIKSVVELRSIPVVVLSSSDSEEEIAAAYRAHANCYVVKPVSLDAFMRTLQSIRDFWGGTQLPGAG